MYIDLILREGQWVLEEEGIRTKRQSSIEGPTTLSKGCPYGLELSLSFLPSLTGPSISNQTTPSSPYGPTTGKRPKLLCLVSASR